MKDNFKKTIIWTNTEPPKNYLWAKDNKLYEYINNWREFDSFKEPFVAVEDISLNRKKLSLKPGKSATLNCKIFPENATDKCITWITSNPEIIEVVNGKITAKSEGVANVYAAIRGKYAGCEISVSKIV